MLQREGECIIWQSCLFVSNSPHFCRQSLFMGAYCNRVCSSVILPTSADRVYSWVHTAIVLVSNSPHFCRQSPFMGGCTSHYGDVQSHETKTSTDYSSLEIGKTALRRKVAEKSPSPPCEGCKKEGQSKSAPACYRNCILCGVSNAVYRRE